MPCDDEEAIQICRQWAWTIYQEAVELFDAAKTILILQETAKALNELASKKRQVS